MSRQDYDRLNEGCAFPPKVEGYWRSKEAIDESPRADKTSRYPWPVVFEVEGYDRQAFMADLARVQMDSRVDQISYRGVSIHRLLGTANGCSEFEYDGWTWPSGYYYYIKMGVPPSRDFYEFITGKRLDTLPTYGRD